jgi:hypothetical protein
MKTGIELIAEERQRQIEQEGWSSEHDDQYKGEEMARAAACYSMPRKFRNYVVKKGLTIWYHLWPWGLSWWKTTDEETPEGRIRELQKAGALNAAEIDWWLRKLRKENKTLPEGL